MGKNPGDPYFIPIVVILLVVSLPFGLFPWAALITVGLAAIQAGLHGFRSTGYEWGNGSRMTGRRARILGGTAIAFGAVWEIVVIGSLISAICGYGL